MRHGVLHGVTICLTILPLALIAGCGSGSGGATPADHGGSVAAAPLTGMPAELLPNAEPVWSGKVPVDAGAGSLEGIFLRQTPDLSGKFDSTLYLIGSNHHVVALDRHGLPRWVFHRMDLPPEFPPAEGPTAVVFVTRKKLWIVDRVTGSLINACTLPFTPSAPPVVSGSAVYIPSLSDDRVYAVGIRDGAVGWRVRLSGPISAAPAIAGSVGQPSLHVATEKGGLFAFEALDATASPPEDTKWQRSLADGVVADLTTSNDRTVLYVPSEDFSLHAYRAATGERVWAYSAGRPLKVSAIEVGETVFIRNDKDLVALHGATGAVKWSLPGVQRPICQWGGQYLLRDDAGKFLRVDAGSGEVIATGTLPAGVPADFVLTDRVDGRLITADRNWNLSVLARRKY